jgi:peptidylprolyl isomerase/FKBP-type peptidyl-prolyl cis-trans isomerase FklB
MGGKQMKTSLMTAALGLVLAVPAFSSAAPPTSFEDKLSYSMGFEVGSYFKRAGGDIQKEFLLIGIEDAFKGVEPTMSAEDMLAVKKEFAARMQARQMAMLDEMKAKNKTAGEAYLAENKKKSGVTVTASGLQYEVVKKGQGKNAGPTDSVKVQYTGTLIDGTEFDSTVSRGEAAEFQVDQVIKGWSEALQLMNPGSKLRLVIPSELAYGEGGAAPMIEPNSVLVFDVEMISIGEPAAK